MSINEKILIYDETKFRQYKTMKRICGEKSIFIISPTNETVLTMKMEQKCRKYFNAKPFYFNINFQLERAIVKKLFCESFV